MRVVNARDWNVAAGHLEKPQGSGCGVDGFLGEAAAFPVSQVVPDLYGQKTGRVACRKWFKVARACGIDARASGALHSRVEDFLRVDGRFASGDDQLINSEPSDLDALKVQRVLGVGIEREVLKEVLYCFWHCTVSVDGGSSAKAWL